MKTTLSQNQIIADYLKSGKSIDSSTAYRICGTMCLAQRIANIKKPPYNLDIDTKMVYESGRNYAVYMMKSVTQQQSVWERIYSNAALI